MRKEYKDLCDTFGADDMALMFGSLEGYKEVRKDHTFNEIKNDLLRWLID